MEKDEVKQMTNEEAINELLQCYSLYSPFKTAKKTNEAISMAIKALEKAPTFKWLMQKADEWGMSYGKQFLIEAQRAWKDGKDTNVPTNSALDHIHNVVRDDAYRRGYEQGKADMAYTIKDKTLFIKISEEDVDRIKRVLLDCDPWCKTFYEDDKDTNVPTKWIPCSKRLPEEGQEILATEAPNGWYDVVIIRTYYAMIHKSVIAWMPLPEPWKGK